MAIALLARLNPLKLEKDIDTSKKYESRLDTLLKSKTYFDTEFKGELTDKIIIPLEAEIELCEAYLKRFPMVPTMALLATEDYPKLEVGIKILINDLRYFFAIDNMISDNGINALAPMLIYEFTGLTVEDVAICFTQAKKGYYGEIYNRLDGQIIMKWLRSYHNEKIDRLKEKSYALHRQSKSGSDPHRKVASSSELLNEAHAAMLLNKEKK